MALSPSARTGLAKVQLGIGLVIELLGTSKDAQHVMSPSTHKPYQKHSFVGPCVAVCVLQGKWRLSSNN
jgi:hypothetical protein